MHRRMLTLLVKLSNIGNITLCGSIVAMRERVLIQKRGPRESFYAKAEGSFYTVDVELGCKKKTLSVLGIIQWTYPL